jgi:hypothetical protein
VRRLSILIAVIALFGALGTASAQAVSPWTLTNLNLGDSETIFGMHCEPTGFCIGVGQEGVLVQSTAPTAGATAWTIGHVAVTEQLRGNLRGISCPSATLCVAVDFSGGVWTTNDPGAGAASWVGTRIPKATSLFGVSCVSTTDCVLVGANGLVVTSTNPTGGATAWTRTTLPNAPSLRSVSCTGTLCAASAYNGEIWTTNAAAGGATAWTSAGQPSGESPLLGIDCLSETLCTVGGEGKALLSTAPTAGTAAWPTIPLSTRFQVVNTDCPSATLCVLSSNNGEMTASTNPLGGPTTWLTEHLIKGVTNALFGLSCPVETLCVAAGKFGQILTSTAPAATGLPEPPPPPPPPTNVLVHRPAKVIHLGVKTPAPTVSFRFKGSGIGPFWFRCKLDSKPGAICAAPFKKRVGVGKHTFRVRAFGPGGGAATQLVYKFKVERAKPKPKPKPKPKKHHQKGAGSG